MSEAAIDSATFNSLTQLVGEDFIDELVETFFEESPGLLTEMDRALADGDAQTFRRAAHSLKSNSASFGATEMANLARELEFMGPDDRLDGAGPKLAQLKVAYEQAVEALKALL